MGGLDPPIQLSREWLWMAGSSPAMEEFGEFTQWSLRRP
jgi:hypothetical protein